ncbi:MAG: hypothetical protein ACFFE7_10325 [Candidatus Thorarchaeota archaeon]
MSQELEVDSDERVIKVKERVSRAEARKKMFDKLSIDFEKKLKGEKKGPRPVLSKVERELHSVERDWKASQRKLEDLKMQSRMHRADIAKAEEEFRHLIHKDVDLEKPVELDTAKIESAKKKLERRVKRATREIAKLEKKIPGLIQEELVQRGRLEQVRIERESIKSGFRDLPIEKDPRMTSFRSQHHRINKEYDDSKVELDDIRVKVRKELKRKQSRKATKSSKKKKSGTADEKRGKKGGN